MSQELLVDNDKIIFEVLAEYASIDVVQIKTDLSISDDLGIDSLGLIEVIMQIEERLGEVGDDIGDVKTVGDLVKLFKSN